MSATDTPEAATETAEPDAYDWVREAPDEPVPDLSWEGFIKELGAWPTKDPEKITLLQLVLQADGEGGSTIDVEDLAKRLGRAESTVTETLRELRAAGWVGTFATLNAAGRPVLGFTLMKTIAG